MNTFQTVVTRAKTSVARASIVRGSVSVGFGVVLTAWPAPTVGVILLAFSLFAITDGVTGLATSRASAPKGERWPSVLASVSSIAAGLVGLLWPGITALTVLYVIGVSALAKGIGEIGAAVVAPPYSERRGLTGLVGALSVVFGVLMLAHPGRGAVAIVSLIAAMAIVNGVALVAGGIRLSRAAGKGQDRFRTRETVGAAA
jgi:uncharacterized membrane protein HdeD (DUF308 family)